MPGVASLTGCYFGRRRSEKSGGPFLLYFFVSLFVSFSFISLSLSFSLFPLFLCLSLCLFFLYRFVYLFVSFSSISLSPFFVSFFFISFHFCCTTSRALHYIPLPRRSIDDTSAVLHLPYCICHATSSLLHLRYCSVHHNKYCCSLPLYIRRTTFLMLYLLTICTIHLSVVLHWLHI